MPRVKKQLINYQTVGILFGISFILNEIPETTHDRVKGWKCKNGHIFKARYNDIQQGRGCLECSGKLKKTHFDYVQLALSRGFRYVNETIPKNSLKPTLGWICDICNLCEGKWKTSYHSIDNGTGCPYCTQKAVKLIEDYHSVALLNNGEYILPFIPKTSHDEVEGWRCCKGHIWPASYNRIQQGYWCPKCSQSRSEKLVRKIIESEIKIQFLSVRPDFLRYINNKNLELDGYNKDVKLAFEYQGKQHYEFIHYFHKTKMEFQRQQERDKWKHKKCSEMGISLMIIPYQYSYKNPEELKKYIKIQIAKLNWFYLIFTYLKTIY